VPAVGVYEQVAFSDLTLAAVVYAIGIGSRICPVVAVVLMTVISVLGRPLSTI
jgi:hypothetical protein